MENHKLIDFKAIGRRVKQRRLDNKLSQEILAEKMGISPEFVSKIETGAVQVNLKRLAQLSLVLSTPIEHFISGSVIKGEDYKLAEFGDIIDDLTANERTFLYHMAEEIKNLRK